MPFDTVIQYTVFSAALKKLTIIFYYIYNIYIIYIITYICKIIGNLFMSLLLESRANNELPKKTVYCILYPKKIIS